MSRRLFIVGYPGRYGGASTELHHQIILWRKAFPEIGLHIIPTQQGYQHESLYQEMQSLGVMHEDAMEFSMLTKDDAVINFCSKEFLDNVHKIALYTNRIAFTNCMTWTFPSEQRLAPKNYIKFFLYQRPQIRDKHKMELCALGSTAQFIHFIPYYDSSSIEFNPIKNQDKFHMGRISRQDADKFNKYTNLIYNLVYAQPKLKQGHFLGWGHKSLAKIGQPPDWIKTYADQNVFSVADFYKQVDIILQPSDTFENLPRIGFEAMASGVPLVVDDRGGWQYMIEHGVSGFLCKDIPDFVYWSSKLANDPELREKISCQAKKRGEELGSYESSKASWKKVFNKIFN